VKLKEQYIKPNIYQILIIKRFDYLRDFESIRHIAHTACIQVDEHARIQSNDLTCDTHVPNHILFIYNHMMHLCNYLISPFHPIVINKLYVDLISHIHYFYLG
jgi:hypothetical protein